LLFVLRLVDDRKFVVCWQFPEALLGGWVEEVADLVGLIKMFFQVLGSGH
jgi:hypothetical protein